jgi:hypothetical protein
MVFVGASNELGEFESGAAASLLGLVPAVVFGGVGTMVVVALWSVLFPEIRRVDRLDDALVKEQPQGEQEQPQGEKEQPQGEEIQGAAHGSS